MSNTNLFSDTQLPSTFLRRAPTRPKLTRKSCAEHTILWVGRLYTGVTEPALELSYSRMQKNSSLKVASSMSRSWRGGGGSSAVRGVEEGVLGGASFLVFSVAVSCTVDKKI